MRISRFKAIALLAASSVVLGADTSLVSPLPPQTASPAAPGQEPMFKLIEFEGPNNGPRNTPVSVFVAPIFDYDLPRVPLSFRLVVRNDSKVPMVLGDPLNSLELLFTVGEQLRDRRLIDLPRRASVYGIDAPGPVPDQYPAPVLFRRAVVGGREIRKKPAIEPYEMEPGASLEIFFECERIVSERILAAVADGKESSVSVSVVAGAAVLKPLFESRVMRSEQIRLPVPRSK